MKHIKLFENFSVNENKKPADIGRWIEFFEMFLDTPWQEDAEIYIIEQLGEYREKFKTNPTAAWNYVQEWHKTNKHALDRTLGINTSEKFMEMYDALVAGDSVAVTESNTGKIQDPSTVMEPASWEKAKKLKMVVFAEGSSSIDNPVYFVIDEDENNYKVVIDEKMDLWYNNPHKATKAEMEEYYTEWIPKKEMVEYK